MRSWIHDATSQLGRVTAFMTEGIRLLLHARVAPRARECSSPLDAESRPASAQVHTSLRDNVVFSYFRY